MLNPHTKEIRAMKPLSMLLIVIFACAIAASSVSAAPLEDATVAAVDKAVAGLEKAVADQPDKFKKIERVAVIPFRGDAGKSISDLAQIRMTRTSFKIMLRDQIEKIFDEQKFAIDYADLFANKKETVARLGNLLGVNAYLMGDVVRAGATADGGAEVRLNVKLVDVETAQVIWGDAVVGQVVPPPIPTDWGGRLLTLAIGAVVLVALIALVMAYSNSRRRAQEREAERIAAAEAKAEDRARRNQIQNELLKSVETLREIERISKPDIADRLHRMRDRLDVLRREADLAKPLSGDASNSTLVEWQEVFSRLARQVSADCLDLHKTAAAGDPGPAITGLEVAVAQLEVKWADRPAVLQKML